MVSTLWLTLIEDANIVSSMKELWYYCGCGLMYLVILVGKMKNVGSFLLEVAGQ